MDNYLVRYTAQDEFASFTGTEFHATLELAQADAEVKNAAMREDSRHWQAFALVPAVPAPLTIPQGLAVVIEPNGDETSFRIECRHISGVDGKMAEFGEVAYWYPDGENDIMQGRTGSVLEATQALVDFTAQN